MHPSPVMPDTHPPTWPESTYRLQFHSGFTFRDATEIVPYLRELGITHCYASPYLKARPGSTHGYDVIDHCTLNPEIGSEADYEAWLAAMREHGLSHVLDIVPNHVGVATNENVWWNNVLENGRDSKYAAYFDIAWNASPRRELRGKVLLPLLGETYAQVLEAGQLRLVYENGAVAVHYYDRRFPIAPRTYPALLRDAIDRREPSAIAQAVDRLNGSPGDAKSFDLLDDLLSRQCYRLAYWRVAPDEINYRRFFDVNDLAALSMERPAVYEAAHKFIFQLLREGKVQGLRIDHPDGLYDPRQYLQRLAETPGVAKPLYVVVEKILALGEALPGDWPVAGTSGYDFLNMVNGLYVRADNAKKFSALYRDLTGERTEFADLICRKKLLILQTSLSSELHMLADALDRLAQRDRRSRDFTLSGLRDALAQVIACFPVYRSYITAEGVGPTDRRTVQDAIVKAIARSPATEPEVFHFIRDLLLQRHPRSFTEDDRAAQLRFACKFQQLTSPVTAKGIEDTAFYIYNRLTSLNEVGGDPGHFGIAPNALHDYLKDRQAKWPFAMSCLSTHDTKRSEDVRARINVLSEMPDEWREHIERWRELNAASRTTVGAVEAPDRNDEYLIYQTLVGAWPIGNVTSEEHADFVARIVAYMQKALREAKIHTGWTLPNEEYESAVKGFIEQILDRQTGHGFLADFEPFQRSISSLGLFNSLSQTLLRLTSPGVPDTYQGSELWDFSLVDPDNRRPVDYPRRRRMLADVQSGITVGSRAEWVEELIARKEDGRIKLFITTIALQQRRQKPGLFSSGAYHPAVPAGAKAENVLGFVRRQGKHAAVVIAPRFFSGLVGTENALPLGENAWRDTTIQLNGVAAQTRLVNVFTGETLPLHTGDDGSISVRLSEALARFPVGLFVTT
jgi:(1->4)-alpha-D-glucan 1-alpha-D-glucosylmutase